MKVLGEAQDGFILIASKNEVALLRGFDSKFGDGYRSPDLGTEFDIGDIARRVAYLRNLDTKTLAQLISQVDAVKEQLQAAQDSVLKLNMFEKIKE